MGWLPSVVRHDIESLRLYNQFCKMPDWHLTKQIIIYMFNKSEMQHGSWSQNLYICESINELDKFGNNECINIREAQNRLIAMYILTWHEKVNSQGKLSNFSVLNLDMETSPHLLSNVDKYSRSLCSQLRLGCLPIEIETGGYTNVTRVDCICKLCNNEAEDECHFLFNCQKTQTQHVRLYYKLPELLNCTDSSQKMKMLFQNPFIVSKYITDLWNCRTNMI